MAIYPPMFFSIFSSQNNKILLFYFIFSDFFIFFGIFMIFRILKFLGYSSLHIFD